MDTDLPVEQPATSPVHIYTTDLQGAAALRATGGDGEEYCVIDSAVLIGNPIARECARWVFVEACELSAGRRTALTN